jgi:hypothetical protein
VATRHRPSRRSPIASRAVEGLYQWIVLLHVTAAFTFAIAHGVSAGVALKLRSEREIPRVQALLDLSQFSTNGMYVSIFVLVIAGVAAAFIAGLWGRVWIWAAIVVLVLMFAAMYARAATWFRDLRRAAGQAYETGKDAQPAERPDAARLATLTASSRPMEVAAIGYGGLVLILWLMVMKPFRRAALRLRPRSPRPRRCRLAAPSDRRRRRPLQ